MVDASWSVDVDIARAAKPDPKVVERWLATLGEHAPDIWAPERPLGDGRALVTVTVTVDAESLVAAAARAVELVEAVTDGTAVGVMAFGAAEYETHVAAPFVYRRESHSLVGYGDVENLAGA